MPPAMLLIGPFLPWFAGVRLTLSFWEVFAFGARPTLPAKEMPGIDPTVVLFPSRPPRRAATAVAGGKLLPFALPRSNHRTR